MKNLFLGILLTMAVAQVYAQGAGQENTGNTREKKATFVCPDHPKEQGISAGECRECGKTLVQVSSKNYKGHKVEETKTVYSCSKHPTVQQDEAGRCPECGVALKEVSVKNYKGHVKGKEAIYTCSHHPEVLREGPGACPVCKKPLTERKADAPVEKNNKNYKKHIMTKRQ